MNNGRKHLGLHRRVKNNDLGLSFLAAPASSNGFSSPKQLTVQLSWSRTANDPVKRIFILIEIYSDLFRNVHQLKMKVIFVGLKLRTSKTCAT